MAILLATAAGPAVARKEKQSEENKKQNKNTQASAEDAATVAA